MLKVKRGTKGFTLIELLIVIAIIGILAAIAIPAYSGYTKKSKIAGVVNAMGAVKNAVTAYYAEQGTGTLDLDHANIQSNLSVSIPTQYVNATGTSVNATNENNIVITANIANVGSDVDGKTITLTGNMGNSTWTWGGTIDKAYIPKSK